MKYLTVINLKAYEKAFTDIDEIATSVAQAQQEADKIRFIVSVPSVLYYRVKKIYPDVFLESVDACNYGSKTGKIPAKSLAALGIKGTLVNHAENKIKLNDIHNIVSEKGFEKIVCTANSEESKAVAVFNPDYIAVEPPELIGTGISVSQAKPEVIKNTVDAVKSISDVDVLCGAGISNNNDFASSIEYGAKGVLLASAFVKAKNRKQFLLDLVSSV